jgi:hypothetical protein
MFEGLSELLAGWRTVAHVAEWTELSVGALAAIGAVVVYDPRVLKPAIGAAMLLGAAYAGTLYGDRTGRTDVEAQWADARKAAIAAEHERDQMAEQTLQAKYGPRLEELARQAADNKRKADGYEHKLLTAKVADAGKDTRKPVAVCELGAAADRVRGSPGQARDVPAGRHAARGRPAGGV